MSNKIIQIKGVVDLDLGALKTSLDKAKGYVEGFITEMTNASQIQIGASLANADAITNQIQALNEQVAAASIQANQAAADAQIQQAKDLTQQQITLAESHNAEVTRMAENLVAQQKQWLEEEHQKQLQLVKDTYSEAIETAKQLATDRAELTAKERKEEADRDLKMAIATQKNETAERIAEGKIREAHYQARKNREFEFAKLKINQESAAKEAEAKRVSAVQIAEDANASKERIAAEKQASVERIQTYKTTLDNETRSEIAENALRESHYQKRKDREFKYREGIRDREFKADQAAAERASKEAIAADDRAHAERMKNIQIAADEVADKLMAETQLRKTELEQTAQTQRDLQLRLSEQIIDQNREIELSKREEIRQTNETQREQILSKTLLEKTQIEETEKSRRDSITAMTAIQIASINSTHNEEVEKMRIADQARKDDLQAFTVLKLADMAEAHQKELTNAKLESDERIARAKEATIATTEAAKRHNEVVINDIKESGATEREVIKATYAYRSQELKSFADLEKTQLEESAESARHVVTETRRLEEVASKERIEKSKQESQLRIEEIRNESKEKIASAKLIHDEIMGNLKLEHETAINNSKIEEAQRAQDSKQSHEKAILQIKNEEAERKQSEDIIHKQALENIKARSSEEREQIKANTQLALEKLDHIHEKEMAQIQMNYDMIANMRLREFTAEENEKDRLHELTLEQSRQEHQLVMQQNTIEAQAARDRFAESRRMIAKRAKDRKEEEEKADKDAADAEKKELEELARIRLAYDKAQKEREDANYQQRMKFLKALAKLEEKAAADEAAKTKAEEDEIEKIKNAWKKLEADRQKANDDTASKFRKALEKGRKQQEADIAAVAKKEEDAIKRNEELRSQLLKKTEQENKRFHRAFFSRMENGWKGIERFAINSIQNIGRALLEITKEAAQIGAGVVRESISSYGALDSSLNTVRAISQPGEADKETMAALKETIMKTDLELPLDVTQVGEAVETLKRAGFEIKEIIKLTPYVGKLATATNTEVDTTSNVVSAFANSFREVDPEVLMNQIMVAANNSNQTIEDLLQSLVSLKGAFKMDESEDFLALTMMLADAGMKGSSAGTAVRNAQNYAEKSENKETLDKMGVTLYRDDEGRVKPLEFFREIFRARKAHTDEAATIFRDIFQERGVAVPNNAIKKTEAELDAIEALLNQAGTGGEGNTELDKAANVQMQGFAGVLKMLESTVGNFFVTLGDGMSQFVQASGVGLAEMIQSVVGDGDLVEGMKSQLSSVVAIFGEITTNEMGQEIFTLNEDTKAKIQEVALLIRESIIFLAANMPAILELSFKILDALIKSIPTLVNAANFFLDNWKLITATIITIIATIKLAFFAAFLAAQGVAMATIIGIATAMGAILLAALPWIAAIAGVVALVTLIVVKLKENQKFMEGWNTLTTALKNTWNNIVEQVGRLWTGIIAIVTQSAIFNDIASGLKAIWDGILWVFTSIGNALGSMLNWIASLFGGVSEVNDEANGLKDAVTLILGIAAELQAIIEIIYEVLKFLIVEAAKFLWKISGINTVVEALKLLFDGLVWLVNECVKGASNFITNAKKAASESKVLKTLWESLKVAITAIAVVLFPMIAAFFVDWEGILGRLGIKTDGISSTFETIGTSIKNLITNTRDWINQFIPLDAILDRLDRQKAEHAGDYGEGGSSTISGVEMPPEIAAFIEMFRHGEGTTGAKGYTTMFTGKQFTDMSDHPRQLQSGGGFTSDAAGVGQFLSTTWDMVAAQIGAKDFSNENQIKGIIQLIKNRDAYDDLMNGNLDAAFAKLSHEWASLPISTTAQAGRYGQPAKTGAEAKEIYERELAKIKNNAGGTRSSSAVGGITAVDTGHVTGPSAYIGGSTEYHIDVKFDVNKMSQKEMIAAMDQMALKYKRMGREVEFSNRGVEGKIWDAGASMDKKIELFRKVTNAHAARPGWAAVDFYAPKIGKGRSHESAVAAPIVTPAFEGGTVQNYKNGKGYGAFSNVSNSAGETVITIGHGDNRKGNSRTIKVGAAKRGPYDTRVGPFDTRTPSQDDNIDQTIKSADATVDPEAANKALADYKRQREALLRQELANIASELEGSIKELENNIALENLKEKPDAKKVATMTSDLTELKNQKALRTETATLKSGIDIATKGQSLGAGDADLNKETIDNNNKRLKELGVEYASAVGINTATLAKSMREALEKEAKEALGVWNETQKQLYAREDHLTTSKRSEEDAAHREALLTATDSEKTILNLKRDQLLLDRQAYDEVLKEKRSLLELKKIKELGVKNAEGYSIDQAIALSEQKIKEMEINAIREKRLALAEKELEIHKSLTEKSKSLIGAEFGGSITLPKTEVDDLRASIEALNKEQLANTDEINQQIEAIDNFIEASPDMSEEMKASQLKDKADLEMKHQLNALDADRKRMYVEGKISIAKRSKDIGDESSLIGLKDQVNEAQAAALEAAGSTNMAEKLRRTNDLRKEELRLQQALLDIEARRLEVESNTTMTKEQKAKALEMLAEEVRLQNELHDASKKAIEVASSETAKLLQAVRKQAIEDLSSGLHDVLMGTKTLGQALTDVFKNLASMLIKMAAQKLFQRIFDGIGGGSKSGGNDASGVIGAVVGLLRRNDGGMVPMGSFKRGVDSVPALLTPGEGVLTTKEVGLLGGPRGFEEFRKGLRGYNTGGIVNSPYANGVGSVMGSLDKRQQVSYKLETQMIGGVEVVTADQLRGLEARMNNRTDSAVAQSQRSFSQRLTNDVESRTSLGFAP